MEDYNYPVRMLLKVMGWRLLIGVATCFAFPWLLAVLLHNVDWAASWYHSFNR